jgi:hypothetical protein
MGRQSKNAKTSTGQKRKARVLYEDADLIIGCPAKPDGLQPRGVTDIFKDRDHPGVEKLAIDFNIRPGGKWGTTKGYTNVKCKSDKDFQSFIILTFTDQDQTFSAQDFIFVNRTDLPSPPKLNNRAKIPPMPTFQGHDEESCIQAAECRSSQADSAVPPSDCSDCSHCSQPTSDPGAGQSQADVQSARMASRLSIQQHRRPNSVHYRLAFPPPHYSSVTGTRLRTFGSV